MTRKNLTNPEVRQEGLGALLERLGPADTIRFLQQYSGGSGDYSTERRLWLDGLPVNQLADEIRQRREKNEGN